MEGKSSHLNWGDLTGGSLAVVTTNCEKSAEVIGVPVMGMKRKGEQSISVDCSPREERTQIPPAVENDLP